MRPGTRIELRRARRAMWAEFLRNPLMWLLIFAAVVLLFTQG